MMDSSYYKARMNDQLNLMKKYAKQYKELGVILENLQRKLNDEVADVNRLPQTIAGELNTGIRHLSSFSAKISYVDGYREPYPDADGSLSSAIQSIQAEMRRISDRHDSCQASANSYKNSYNTARQEEKNKKRK